MSRESNINIDDLFKEKLSEYKDKPSDKSVNRILDSIIDHSTPVSFWSKVGSFALSSKGMVAGLCALATVSFMSYNAFYNKTNESEKGELAIVVDLDNAPIVIEDGETYRKAKSTFNVSNAGKANRLNYNKVSDNENQINTEGSDRSDKRNFSNGNIAGNFASKEEVKEQVVFRKEKRKKKSNLQSLSNNSISNNHLLSNQTIQNNIIQKQNSAVFANDNKSALPQNKSSLSDFDNISHEKGSNVPNEKGTNSIIVSNNILQLQHALPFKDATLATQYDSEVEVQNGDIVSISSNTFSTKRRSIQKAFTFGLRTNFETATEKNKYIKGNVTSAGEFNVSVFINNLQLQTGVQYSRIGSKFIENYSYEYDTIILFDSVVGINLETGEQITKPGYKTDEVNGLLENKAYVTNSIVGIPLSIGYAFKQKKICFVPKVGFVFSKVYKGKENKNSLPQGWKIMEYHKEAPNMINSFLSYTASVEFSYALTNSATVVAEPYIKYRAPLFLTNDNTVHEHEKLIGIKFGLNYLL